MTEDEQGRQKTHTRLWVALGVLAVILAVLIVPLFLSVNSYKSRITSLMAASLGRPVRLSSVRVRLLPRPGFVLHDLTVEEDPVFGAEPLLHANEVTASIRLLSLWRGRLEISEVSVDEASLNLVRMPEGRWNLESLVQTAAAKAGPGGVRVAPFPYLAATNSRVNFKNGVEKLPFSVVDADISFFQKSPGEWRIRLRGQPARTDVSLNQADTGIVELEASARRAADLHKMPIHLDLDWRDAQLGQLTRLATGSDAGWRGDLHGEVHLDGTAEAAQITTRLRATKVHRAEFAPATSMDFDANCSLIYHYSERAVEKLACDSPLGNGHVRLAGDLPGGGGTPHFSVELDRIPVGAGLDALRTVRSSVDPGLEAAGTASGKVSYDAVPAAHEEMAKPAAKARSTKAAAGRSPEPKGPLTGSFTVEGFALSGGGLSRPIQAPKMVLEPVAGQTPALAGTATVALGGAAPLAVNVHLEPSGYQVTLRGQASIARSREIARAVGIQGAAALDTLAGDALVLDLSAAGPWLPMTEITAGSGAPVPPVAPAAPAAALKVVDRGAKVKAEAETVSIPAWDSLSGTVTVRNANWKADYLANHVVIAEATLHVNLAGGNGENRWDPVEFTYGPLKGTASLTAPARCPAPESCTAHFEMQFDELDAATVQTAILGAQVKGTLLSDLINRLRPATAPVWPQLDGTVKADALTLGPVTVKNATAVLRLVPTGAEIASLDGTLLGGSVHGAGTLVTGDKPSYTLSGAFNKLNPVAVGELLGEKWRGGTLDANGNIELAGYAGKDLASSAKGALHFEWRHGAVGAGAAKGAIPPALTRFDRWTADAAIANGKIALGKNEVAQGGRKVAVDGTVTLSEPAKASFGAAGAAAGKKR